MLIICRFRWRRWIDLICTWTRLNSNTRNLSKDCLYLLASLRVSITLTILNLTAILRLSVAFSYPCYRIRTHYQTEVFLLISKQHH